MTSAETTDAREVARRLGVLLEEGGDHNRLLIECGDAYLLFMGGRGEATLECEAVSNERLPAAAKLTPERLAILEAAGFVPQRGRRNLTRRWEVAGEGSLAAIAEVALDVLARAYGVAAGEPRSLKLHLGDREPTRNVELIRSMKKLARLRDHGSRQAVYRGILASDLLLVLDPESDPGDHEPHVVERLQGYPCFGVFTDWDALRLWEPRGWPYVVLPGHQIVRLVEAAKAGSLLINPRGDVGGELLMNEIAALADAARRRYAG